MMPRSLRLVPLTFFAVATLFAQRGDKPDEIQQPVPAGWKIPPAPILTAEEALRSFTVAPGFRVELAAADPLVGDPVSAVFGPDGRLWVVEMRSYMPDIDGHGEEDPVGCIAVLEDTNADGRFDKRTVFLDRLVLPRGVSLVDDGVLIAEPPHLWFARDTDGDGIADSKVEVASNYGGVGNPEHMANGLVWMMDNWIYSANHKVRYRYQGGGKFSEEPTITRGQWGIAQDDTGRLYYNSNSDPLRVDAVPSAYFSRNPHLGTARGTNVQVAPEDLPTWPGRITPGVNRGYKILRPDGTLPSVTAACGPAIYRGHLFPAEFRGDAFICEPSGNLVKRIRVTEQEGKLTGSNAYENTEFLTSTDERFRPVSAFNGPDGALWIVDMYRGVIQHRTYVTSYLRAQVKDRRLEEGRGLGRIWRIVPDTTPSDSSPANLAKITPLELVQQLRQPAGWVRDTAQRLLVERQDPATVAPLQALVRSVDAPPLARLHALWTLEGLSALDRSSVLAALGDDDPRVSAGAIRLAEKWLADPADQELFRRVTALTMGRDTSPPPGVILQQALSLGSAASPEKHSALARLAEEHGILPYVADAIASGIGGTEEAFIELVATRSQAEPAGPAVAAAVRSALHSGDVARTLRILGFASNESPAWIQKAVLDGVAAFLPRRADGAAVVGLIPVEPTPLLTLAERPDTTLGERATDLLQHLRWPGKPGAKEAAAPLTEAETGLFEIGRAHYAALCAACHQPEGQGLEGLAPPLVNSRWVLGPENLAASIVLSGKSDDGKIMPALRAVLDDQAIASVLTYVRNSWGHAEKAVAVETVAKVRAETATRSEPFNEAELVQLSQ